MGKRDTNYYELFVELGNFTVKAANLLDKTLANYENIDIENLTFDIHKVEHEADIKKHNLVEKLAKEFMTPLEREDILQLADQIDNVIDSIEEVVMKLYMFNIKEIRMEAKKLSEAIIRSTTTLVNALKEFENFRKSKTLTGLLVEVNDLEEKSDEIYMQAVRRLYVEEKDPITILTWTKIFDGLEAVSDKCEHVCDIVESVILKNS